MIKLLALDLDGTLLNDEEQISHQNKAAIQQAIAAGVHICLATGRGIHTAENFYKQLQLTTPLVTGNGAEIWLHPAERHLHLRRELSIELVKQLHEFAQSLGDCWFWADTDAGIFNLLDWIDPANDYTKYTWLKFGYYTENSSLLALIHRRLVELGNRIEITNSSPYNWEVNAAGVSKASAVAELCQLLRLEMSEVAVMGDSLNDISMIRAAGFGVAVGNAQDEVKEAADVIVVTNNEHAVAYFIHNYVIDERGAIRQ